MPHENEENQETGSTGSSLNIAAWWRKIHFSGRVIMLSVLLGFGLILIGGLLFAINTDGNGSKTNSDDMSNQPTKAPSRYTGPVVMGIGGFIVVIGVVMCLFETQVCRKRTADSRPLITETIEDPENNDADPASVASTSHCQKSHRHGARKTSPSPRKSKSRRVKSQSKERNQQKSPSPKSPPVPIEPSKSFMTSSEDKFLTPPNTLDGNTTLVKKVHCSESDDKHSALMKSFTSSDPSWNQSAEFLTPSTSFRDLSATLNNSQEVNKNQDAVNLKATELSAKQHMQPEYMTPLTVEEDRFQKLLIRVKNEQKQMADAKRESSTEISENSESENYLSSSEVQSEIINKDNEVGIKVENEDNPTQELLSEALPVSSPSKDANQEQTIQVENALDVNQNKYETNVSEDLNDEISEETVNATEGRKLSSHDDEQGKISSHDDEQGKISSHDDEQGKISSHDDKQGKISSHNDKQGKISSHDDEQGKFSSHDDEQGKISSTSESPSPINENEDRNLATCSDKETSDDKVEEKEKQIDFESSSSSDETVVSPDSFQENPINNGPSTEEATLLNLGENSTNENEGFNNLESPGNDKTATDNDYVDHLNNQMNIPNSDEVGASDLNLSETNNVEVVALGMENVSKEESS